MKRAKKTHKSRKPKAKRPKAKAKQPKAKAKQPRAKAARLKARPKHLRTIRSRMKASPQPVILTHKPEEAEKPRRPRKIARISKAEWSPIRRMLLEKRNAIMGAMHKNQETDLYPEVGDEADQAGQSIEKELRFELSDNERTQLDQIEGALRKMDKGTFGICEHCQNPIQKMRIKALPFARYCIACQNSSEKATLP